ncbi:transcriptional regulator [uncultured Rothia sp.]|uniref:transcriptional regulator n=1 Tax=uncultured Rothia sp. TaxID=316088 RepID=UPI0026110B39|nr:transcriptional regulator [uncultured Rothia sp.]
MEDSTPDFEALYEYLVHNGPEVFTPLIRAEEDEEKRRFYLALQTYSLQQKQRIVLADENFVV